MRIQPGRGEKQEHLGRHGLERRPRLNPSNGESWLLHV